MDDCRKWREGRAIKRRRCAVACRAAVIHCYTNKTAPEAVFQSRSAQPVIYYLFWGDVRPLSSGVEAKSLKKGFPFPELGERHPIPPILISRGGIESDFPASPAGLMRHYNDYDGTVSPSSQVLHSMKYFIIIVLCNLAMLVNRVIGTKRKSTLDFQT